jgi:hypothetical protein
MPQCAASVSLMNWFDFSWLPGRFIPAKAVGRFQEVRSNKENVQAGRSFPYGAREQSALFFLIK